MYDIAFLSTYECYRSIPFVSKNMLGSEIVNHMYNVSDDGPSDIKRRSRNSARNIKYESSKTRIDISDLGNYPLPINFISRDQLNDRYKSNILNTIYWG